MTGRLFIVDHMAAMPYGHNLNCMSLFASALADKFGEIILLASKNLSDEAEEVKYVRRELYYPYEGVAETTMSQARWLQPIIRSAASNIHRRLHRLAHLALNEWLELDVTRRRSEKNWSAILKRHHVGKEDVIFFPSSDYYGCLSLFDALMKRPTLSMPKVHFRFIGVMEGAAYKRGNATNLFFRNVASLTKKFPNLTLSAEVPRYARYIATTYGLEVAYLPYPLGKPSVKLNWETPKVISSPGQGRADKGFYRVASISQKLHGLVGSQGWKLQLQDMREGDSQRNQRYVRTLHEIDQVELLPARLSQQEIDKIYECADILILPYDRPTYYLRGSAVFQEGVATGRPVVASSGTGIADLVLQYGNGLIAADDTDFARKLRALMELPKEDVEVMTANARMQYLLDFERALSQLKLSWGTVH